MTSRTNHLGIAAFSLLALNSLFHSLAGLNGNLQGSERILTTVVHAVVGVASLVAAYALWSRRAEIVGLYATWAVTYLVGRGALQVVVDGDSPLKAGIWLLFTGAVCFAFGVYLGGRTAN